MKKCRKIISTFNYRDIITMSIVFIIHNCSKRENCYQMSIWNLAITSRKQKGKVNLERKYHPAPTQGHVGKGQLVQTASFPPAARLLWEGAQDTHSHPQSLRALVSGIWVIGCLRARGRRTSPDNVNGSEVISPAWMRDIRERMRGVCSSLSCGSSTRARVGG